MSRIPKIGINGFGRIGRLVTRALLEREEKVDIVAINDLSSADMLANLFEFDSIHGRFNGSVEVDGNDIILNGDRFTILSERDPASLPWKELEADYVIESTGKFRDRQGLQKHIDAGAKRVILSAPGKDVDVTVVRGVNFDMYDPSKHFIVSNASCTTNCLAPVLKVLDDRFKVEHAIMTTIHSVTNDQRLLDSQHKDFRRARAAYMSMIPTSTGAAKAIGLVMPHLNGKVDGLAVRVPVSNVSLVDLTARVAADITHDDVEEAFREAAKKEMKGIIDIQWRSLVSIDFNHDPHSAIVDLPTLKIVDKSMVKVLAWYDNEWGYANRVADLLHYMWNKEPEK